RSMTALRCFCKVMAEQGKMQNDPSRGMRNMPVERCRITTEEEAGRVEQMLEEVPTTPRGCRDLAMLHLLAGSDLLVQELLRLNVQDVDTKNHQLRVPEHSEPLALPEKTWNALERYLKLRPAMDRREGGEEALFLNWSGGRLSRQGFWKVACEYSKRVGASINLQVLRAYSSHKRYSTLSPRKEKE
ncbi:MAG: tyrosine-type recombinase/integrase, partial [Clostridia bacterium]|nr:tyrosine-type recombinase/integrase [Clostridia bacterium]